MSSHLDPQLEEKIVHEVKSQGVFDEFRKDCMADVDTKPAYQNLRQRVENSVKKFLSEQRWTPDTNKYQLRERLRRHIAESGFLDVGVERIVDQVVNPKIGSVFQPRIEEIAYKYLGVPPPMPMKFEPPLPMMHALPPLPPMVDTKLKIETCSLLPTDLEQVSPDSDKATVKSECKDDSHDMDMDEKLDDDDESPPFEPLVKCESPISRHPIVPENNACTSDMDESETPPQPTFPQTTEEEPDKQAPVTQETPANAGEMQENSISDHTAEPDSEKEASRSMDLMASQDSQLSQVSTDSHISSGSHSFAGNSTATAKNQSMGDAAVNISEEAQMPKFNENSSEEASEVPKASPLHFDIKKDEIKFEGTERKANLLPSADDKTSFEAEQRPEETNGTPQEHPAKDRFKLAEHISESVAAPAPPSVVTHDSSFGSSLEDTSSAQLCIDEKSNKSVDENTAPPSEPFTSMPTTPPHSKQRAEKDGKEHSARHSSSSSSRHKKHTKDKRRRSHDKDQHKSKSRDRSKDSHSRSKQSSSSSKRSSSSSNKRSSSEMATGKGDKNGTVAAAKQTPSSSSSSSSRSESHDAKQRDNEKRHHGSISGKEHANSSEAKDKKRSERKERSATTDDHSEQKEKARRRKSTDSNDDENGGPSGIAGNNISANNKTQADSALLTSTLTTTNRSTKAKDKPPTDEPSSYTVKRMLNDSLEPVDENANQSTHRSKVVILNDLLQNPTTDFIEFESMARPSHAHVKLMPPAVATTEVEVKTELPAAGVSEPDMELRYFEENSKQFSVRLRLLDNAMDRCRQVVNNLRFDCVNYISNYDECELHCDKQEAASTLHITIREADACGPPRKRYKRNDSCSTKTSPTPSDTSSVNSKENEAIDKNAAADFKRALTGVDGSVVVVRPVTGAVRRSHASSVNKLSQQRYSSEDLYKPRPLLSQRSKRRGVIDTI